MEPEQNHVRVGIVGAGEGGERFLELLEAFPAARVQAVCHFNREAPLCRKARERGIAIYPHWSQLLEQESLDWVINLSPIPLPDLFPDRSGKPVVVDHGTARMLLKVADHHQGTENGEGRKRKRQRGRVQDSFWPVMQEIVAWAAIPCRERNQPGDGEAGLFDGQVFRELLDGEVRRASRFSHPLSLVLAEVDDLAAIRQRHGQAAGERITREVGSLLRQSHRASDWVASLDRSNFAALLPNTPGSSACQCLDRIKRTVSERVQTPEGQPVTVSAGLVTFHPAAPNGDPALSVEPGNLIKFAGKALEMAKNKGPGGVAGFPGDCIAV